MSSHVPGEMNITEQKKTFDGFIKAGIWLAVAVAIILVILAIFGI